MLNLNNAFAIFFKPTKSANQVVNGEANFPSRLEIMQDATGFPQVQEPFHVPRFLSVVLTGEKKKKHNLKVQSYVSFGGLAQDLSPGGSL